MVSASSTSRAKPHELRISRVKCRAVPADSGTEARTREVTAGVSHQADGTGSSRGEHNPGSDPAEPLTAKSSPLVLETARTRATARGSCELIARAEPCPPQCSGLRPHYGA